MIHWHGVAGENNDLHDHWVDTASATTSSWTSIVPRATSIEIDRVIRPKIYKIEHKDGDGNDDGVDGSHLDPCFTCARTRAAMVGLINHDELGTITVYGDLVTLPGRLHGECQAPALWHRRQSIDRAR